MTIETLQQQLQTHWTCQFIKYYSVNARTIYDYVGRLWHKESWKKKPPFPEDNLTKSERNELFWNTIGIEQRSQVKAKLKNGVKYKKKKLVIPNEIKYVEPERPVYTWPFANFMNRF